MGRITNEQQDKSTEQVSQDDQIRSSQMTAMAMIELEQQGRLDVYLGVLIMMSRFK